METRRARFTNCHQLACRMMHVGGVGLSPGCGRGWVDQPTEWIMSVVTSVKLRQMPRTGHQVRTGARREPDERRPLEIVRFCRGYQLVNPMRSRDDRQPQFKMKASSAAVLITLGCGRGTAARDLLQLKSDRRRRVSQRPVRRRGREEEKEGASRRRWGRRRGRGGGDARSCTAPPVLRVVAAPPRAHEPP
jgi:hypothetical protein